MVWIGNWGDGERTAELERFLFAPAAEAGVPLDIYGVRYPDEARAMLAVWDELVPPARRPFDMTYSWGPQARSACPSLAMADGRDHPDLLAVFSAYFARPARR